jgi:hypothetical protein
VQAVVFVMEKDPTAPRALLRDLTRRFDNDFVVKAVGEGASVVRLIHEYLPAVEPEKEPAGSATG